MHAHLLFFFPPKSKVEISPYFNQVCEKFRLLILKKIENISEHPYVTI
jgi:hypothetical protein